MELIRKRREYTEKIKKRFAESKEYKLITMKECQFRRLLQTNDEIREFYNAWDPVFQSGKRKLSQEEMLQAIMDDRLYGVAVAKIAVPTTWEESGFNSPLTPQQYFQDFPPIFQVINVFFSAFFI